MSGWVLIAIGILVAASDAAIGLYFLRRGTDLSVPRRGGTPFSPDQSERLGRIILAVAPLPLLVLAALAFGLFGPIEGIETVSLGAG